MKVLLIAPYIYIKYTHSTESSNGEDFYPSTSLVHLAAVLRANNHEPIIIDLNNTVVHKQKDKYLDYCKKIIVDKLNEHKPDLIGINCLFSGSFPDVLRICQNS